MKPSFTIPTISDARQLNVYLKKWQTSIKRLIVNTAQPRVPWNFRLTPQRGSILLAWAKNTDSVTDGYEIVWNTTGDFSQSNNVIPVPSPQQESYLHSIQIQGGTLPTIYYRIRATASGQGGPHTIHSLDSATISGRPLDPSDNVTVPATTYDRGTNDELQAATNRGRYLDPYV